MEDEAHHGSLRGDAVYIDFLNTGQTWFISRELQHQFLNHHYFVKDEPGSAAT